MQSILKCQLDSYTKRYDTTLLEVVDGKDIPSEINVLGLVLEDTILFPEGGGQPSDHGTLKIMVDSDTSKCLEKPCVTLHIDRVIRKDNKVVHITVPLAEIPDLAPGMPVHQSLDWERRQYHMLQHSGQHLLSALAEKLFQFKTLSWNLGAEHSFVELGTADITTEQLQKLEDAVNTYILEGRSMVAHVCHDASDPILEQAKTRGLPDDHVGPIRVIEITGLDFNMCCGTHVSNLQELELIKLVGCETHKKNRLLYFVVGRKRIFDLFNKMKKRETDMVLVTRGVQPSDQTMFVRELLETNKGFDKTIKALHEQLALSEINALKAMEPLPLLFSYHVPLEGQDILNFVARQLKETEITLFLTAGMDHGHVLIVGTKELVSSIGPKVSEVMEGKGKASNNRFNGRVKTGLEFRKAGENLLKQYLNPL